MERPHFDIVTSGARMRAIRQERKISVKQVMEYMGFESTQAVYKWEAGKCFPQADNCFSYFVSCKPDGAFGRRGPGALF